MSAGELPASWRSGSKDSGQKIRKRRGKRRVTVYIWAFAEIGKLTFVMDLFRKARLISLMGVVTACTSLINGREQLNIDVSKYTCR